MPYFHLRASGVANTEEKHEHAYINSALAVRLGTRALALGAVLRARVKESRVSVEYCMYLSTVVRVSNRTHEYTYCRMFRQMVRRAPKTIV